MSKDEKIKLVKDLCSRLEGMMIMLIEKSVPETWDGHELRWLMHQLVKEHFDYMPINKRESRWREFANWYHIT